MPSAGARIAILGATGHIGKGLLSELAGDQTIITYARDREKLDAFIASADLAKYDLSYRCIDDFGHYENDADVVINCTGVGDPARVRDLGAQIFHLTEHFDNRILNWLEGDRNRLYINMSSGAVYGIDFTVPADEESRHAIPVNHIRPDRHYAIAKLNAETKHRAMPNRNIVDLRVFSFFSRFIDLQGRFFMADVMAALIENREIVTRPDEMTRDHVSPADLAALIRSVVARWRDSRQPVNAAVDVRSKGPVGKFALLETLGRELGLRYRVDTALDTLAPTGSKSEYFSVRAIDPFWQYRPQFDSMAGVLMEARALLAMTR